MFAYSCETMSYKNKLSCIEFKGKKSLKKYGILDQKQTRNALENALA